MKLFTSRRAGRETTRQTENAYFKEPPHYTITITFHRTIAPHHTINQATIIVAEEAVFNLPFSLMLPPLITGIIIKCFDTGV